MKAPKAISSKEDLEMNELTTDHRCAMTVVQMSVAYSTVK